MPVLKRKKAKGNGRRTSSARSCWFLVLSLIFVIISMVNAPGEAPKGRSMKVKSDYTSTCRSARWRSWSCSSLDASKRLASRSRITCTCCISYSFTAPSTLGRSGILFHFPQLGRDAPHLFRGDAGGPGLFAGFHPQRPAADPHEPFALFRRFSRCVSRFSAAWCGRSTNTRWTGS